MNRFRLAITVFCFAVTGSSMHAQDSLAHFQGEQIDGPSCAAPPQWFIRSAPRTCTAAETHAWLDDIRHWRDERRIRVGSDGAEYERPGLQWTQSSFVQPQMMVHDRFLYDPETAPLYRRSLPEGFGHTLRRIDSVLVWPTYPNIGIDDRNEYDFFPIFRAA